VEEVQPIVKDVKGKTMLKRILKRIKKKKTDVDSKEYPNRFLKFYHTNKKKLNNQRRSGYKKRRRKGICVRCKREAVEGIVFCVYHQQKQKEYNRKARSK
jgi:hypothetical protein